MTYKEYLKSRIWKRKREQVIVKAGNKCHLCESKENLVVHHVRYPKILGTETLDDMQCLCEDCHNVKCHNGSPRKGKIRLSKLQKRRKKRSKKKAKFAGPVRIYNKQEIQKYINDLIEVKCK